MLSRLLQPVCLFILVSLLLHVGFWEGLNFTPRPNFDPLRAPIEISVIEESPEANRQKSPEQQKQIVEQKQQVNEEVDENAKFLSQFNQKVNRETRADKSGQFQNVPKPGAQLAGQQQKKVREKDSPRKKGELPSLAKLKPRFSPTPKGEEQNQANPGQQSQTDDYLKDTDKGIQTMLSTREFVYYSYYSRIKEKLRQHWEPSIRERVRMMYRTGRNVASAKDLVTQVLVVLNTRGELVRIEVVNQSGNQVLDDAAIDAFRAASPFPNPPAGMIEDDGTVKIRWDFILEANNYVPGGEEQYAEREQ